MVCCNNQQQGKLRGWNLKSMKVGQLFSPASIMNLAPWDLCNRGKKKWLGLRWWVQRDDSLSRKNNSAKWISCNYSEWLKWAASFEHRHGGISFKLNILIGSNYELYSLNMLNKDELFFLHQSSRFVVLKIKLTVQTDKPRVFLESSPLLPITNPRVVNMQTVSSQGSSGTKMERWGKNPHRRAKVS